MRLSKKDDLYLVLDQGGHSSRALVFNDSGECVFSAREPISTTRLPGFRVEHDAMELAESLQKCCDRVAEELGDAVGLVRAAGMATQRSSIVCWENDTGQPLTSVISWQDRRAWEFVESISEKEDDIRDATGLVLSPHYGASKLRWCLQEDAAVKLANQERNLVIGPLASFLVRHLVQANAKGDLCDPANASRTQLWSRHHCDWSPELCDLFEVDRALLPRSVPSEYGYGKLQLGSETLRLEVVTGDQSAVIYAFGAPKADTAYINLGTGAFIQRPIGRKPVDIPGILNSVVFQDGDGPQYVLEGTINGAGSALTWLAKQVDVDSKLLVDDGISEVMTKEPPIFMNGVAGLGSPYWISDFESEWVCDYSVNLSDGLKAVAVLESIAFLVAENLIRMQSSGDEINRVLLTGGLSSVDYLCQAIADACRVNVQRADVKEATAAGVAYLLRRKSLGEEREKQSSSLSDSETASTMETAIFSPDQQSSITLRYRKWQEQMQKRITRN